MEVDINLINKIIKKIIAEISSSRNQILNIVDNIRKDQECLKLQLEKIRSDISIVIVEADELEKQDKAWRRRLVEVSGSFNKYSENDIKEVYEKAADIRVKYHSKKNEEKSLRERRDYIEITLKKTIENIEGAEKIINQIGIALGYLDGDILQALEGTDKNSEMFLGIKILEAQENERKMECV